MRSNGRVTLGGRVGRGLLVCAAAIVSTAGILLVLPFIQAIHENQETVILQTVSPTQLPPPPPAPPEPEEKQEPEEEQKPPELAEEAPPLDLSQIQLTLDPGMGDGWGIADMGAKLRTAMAQGETSDVDSLFSMSELDQKPRVIYQPSPVLDADVRRKAPGKVYVIFIVDRSGRVRSPIVRNASDPAFERPALEAVKQWKFEPGKRNGQPVRFRMGVPITFPKG